MLVSRRCGVPGSSAKVPLNLCLSWLCRRCGGAFTFIIRRHHCRVCGQYGFGPSFSPFGVFFLCCNCNVWIWFCFSGIICFGLFWRRVFFGEGFLGGGFLFNRAVNNVLFFVVCFCDVTLGFFLPALKWYIFLVSLVQLVLQGMSSATSAGPTGNT